MATSAFVGTVTSKVAFLLKPEVGVPSDPELSEEGDILHGALPNTKMSSVQPCSIVPTQAVHRYFAGEAVRALVSFRNNTSQTIQRLCCRVEMQTPQGLRSLYDREFPKLDPFRNVDITVEHLVTEEGAYAICPSLSFSDAAHDVKRIPPRQTPFTVEKCLVEVGRRLVLSEMDSSGASRLCLAFALNNVSDTSVVLTSVRFVPKQGITPTSSSTQLRETDPYIEPRERRVFEFEFTIPRPPLKAIVPTAPRSVDAGHIAWEWRRAFGHGGSDSSSVIRVARPLSTGDVDLFITITDANGRQYQPFDFTVTAVNRSTVRRDVLLVLLTHQFLPHFAYQGPAPPRAGGAQPSLRGLWRSVRAGAVDCPAAGSSSGWR